MCIRDRYKATPTSGQEVGAALMTKSHGNNPSKDAEEFDRLVAEDERSQRRRRAQKKKKAQQEAAANPPVFGEDENPFMDNPAQKPPTLNPITTTNPTDPERVTLNLSLIHI